ncbi:glycerophosphoryl diester phosphodiesterase membrane domain-containing protein [Microbacteriaceae bacterium VKM Ac-2854]|nr:glycerophosphoryl diester phosphodiesterase membrane domain-containing protein [Microbacteriaceae bacterium VKM Ac-2854]
MTDAASWPPPEDRPVDQGGSGAWAPPPAEAWAPPAGTAPDAWAPPASTAPDAWAPPGVGTAPSSAPASPYDADPFAAYTAAPESPQGWTPPPRPGLIPLRPLSFGALLGTPFQVLRRNPKPTLGAALLIQGLGSVAATLIYAVVVGFAIARVAQAAPEDQDAVGTGAIATVLLSALIPLAVSIATGALVQGAIVLEVARGVLSEKPTMRALFRGLRGRIWALIGWAVLTSIALVLLILVGVFATVPVFILGTDAAILIGVLLMLLVGLLFTAVYAWLGTKLALVPSALVIERLPLGRAIARSWRLTRRAFWRTFGVLALMLVIVQVAAQVVSIPVTVLVPLVFSLFAPTDPDAQVIALGVVYLLSIAVGVVLGAIGTVLNSAAAALVYVDRRMRTEGLDLELSRFAEERSAGLDPADPFTREVRR